MAYYDSELTLLAARERYFEANNFGPDGGYKDRWVRVRVGPLPIIFPNTDARRRAVPYHDLHHILTGYETTLRGETEIGAWEVSTGLAHHYVGWLLDLLAFAAGLVINPRGVYRAFMRGRRSTNLFRARFDDELLAKKVGTMRRALGLDRDAGNASPADALAFVAWSCVSVATYAATGAILLAPLAVAVLSALWLTGRLSLPF